MSASPAPLALASLPPVPWAPPPASAAGGKAGWRAIAEALGRERDAAIRKAHADRLAQTVAALAATRDAKTVALYAPIGTEVDTRPLANALIVLGIRLVYPRLLMVAGEMTMALSAGPSALRPRPRSRILEPEGASIEPTAIDLVVVPALAVDGALRRLGRGGGYYDRWLPRRRPDSAVVLVTPASCVLPFGPIEAHDQGGDAVVTEHGLFGRNAR